MESILAKIKNNVSELTPQRIVGQVYSITGLTLCVVGLERVLSIGTRCQVAGKDGAIWGEVVAASVDQVQLLPFGTWHGIAVGDSVEVSSRHEDLRPDSTWIGSIVDGLGRPIATSKGFRAGQMPVKLRNDPPPAFRRRQVGDKIETMVKCVDVFTPLCQGQRLGVFAGSGVGKSTLLAMFARNSQADVNVIALIGERGREVQEFIQNTLGEKGLKRSIVVVATGDESPLMRRHAAWTATAIAEFFRDAGQQVLLLMDSVTRFAMAQREIGLSRNEPPTTKGYPPTVFSELPHLMERAGPGAGTSGDITAIYTVLVDGDDMNEPVADTVRGITDGHIVLDRSIAEKGRFPAINTERSLSRMLPECHANEENVIMNQAKKALARYTDMEDLIRVGAYRAGSDVETDTAVAFFSKVNTYLGQGKSEKIGSEEAFVEIYKMLLEAGIDVPLGFEAE